MNRRDCLGLAGASALASQIARRIEAQEAPAGLRFIKRCGTQADDRDGRHFLYTYNLSSDIDELYNLNAVDAENLVANPEYAAEHKQMVARLGAFLEKDPRWIGYWHSLRIDHYFDLPRPTGDPQMFRPI